MKFPIYLDYSATTPVDPRVAEKMCACLTPDGVFGNPASRSHPFGWAAEQLVDEARANVAALVGADPKEIVWTSGATESDNLAIKGIAYAHRARGNHIITTAIEHSAVLSSCAPMETQGFEVTYLPADEHGLIDPDELESAITDRTILISVMHANNEIGTIQPVKKIGAIARKRGVFFHTDAVQSAGKLPIDVETLAADALAEEGVSCEVIDVATLNLLDRTTILASVEKTGRAVIVEEAPRHVGFGAEIAALLAEQGLFSLRAPVKRVAGYDTIMPLPRLEKHYMPGSVDVAMAARELMEFE